MNVVEETLRILKKASQSDDHVVVAYSDGKDSRAVIDLCLRSFPRVSAFFMELVPGLECMEEALYTAERRWGVTIRRYPHWVAARIIRDGVYCHPASRRDDVPQWKLADVYALAMADTGARKLATGAKKADSGWRRRFMRVPRAEQVLPIAHWHKYDVLAYLRARKIPIPASSGHAATGIDLSTPSLLWLHDTYPRDFARLCEVFPFVEAVVWRRKFYG